VFGVANPADVDWVRLRFWGGIANRVRGRCSIVRTNSADDSRARNRGRRHQMCFGGIGDVGVAACSGNRKGERRGFVDVGDAVVGSGVVCSAVGLKIFCLAVRD